MRLGAVGMHARSCTGVFLLAAAMFIPVLPLMAGEAPAAAGADRIASIKVAGNHFVETGAIMEKIHTVVGRKVDRRRISRDVKRLFATGFFSDIRVVGVVRKDGRHLTYRVKENPMIASMAVEGLHAVKEKDLKLKLKLKSGHIFNQTDLERDIRTIRRGYLKKGYYQVKVDVAKKRRKDGRVDITLNVLEGNVTRIKRIHFIGNEAFPSRVLAKEIASRQSGLMAWFKDRDVFNRDRLQADRQLILQHYLNHGYLDAKVESTVVSLSADKHWFYLTFSIHEGRQYEIGSIDLQGDLVPDRATLMDLVRLHQGELYSLDKMRKSIEAITLRVGDEGYAFATVTPLFHRHINKLTVDITFDIEKGREVYVERIEISGNDKTEDPVIRRELKQAEGARFSRTRLKQSRDKVKKLSLFEDVRVSMPRGSAPDKVHMKIDVTEKRTGSFTVGAGFSQLEKVFVRSSIKERNFLGKGYATNLTGEVGAKTQNFDASITDPYFLDRELSASLNAFKRQTRLQSQIGYKEDSFGGGVNLGMPITRNFSYNVGYQFSDTRLFDLPTDASLVLKSQEGTQTTGELSQGLTWDTRDSLIRPQDGALLAGNLGLAGLGGINRFIELSFRGGAFFPITGGFILNPSLRASYIHGFSGRDVPLFRRYSIGGVGSVRGFDQFGITIRDPATNDVIGGNKMVAGTLNLFFPLPYMQTSGFRGVSFVDAGTIEDFNQTLKFSTLRVSAGFGIEWLSPIGPVGLSWGFPFRKQPGDLTKTFEFNLGSTF